MPIGNPPVAAVKAINAEARHQPQTSSSSSPSISSPPFYQNRTAGRVQRTHQPNSEAAGMSLLWSRMALSLPFADDTTRPGQGSDSGVGVNSTAASATTNGGSGAGEAGEKKAEKVVSEVRPKSSPKSSASSSPSKTSK